MAKLHLIKLCVGIDSLQSLVEWRKAHPSDLPGGLRRHTTRMWPKREAELLNGGSLYWVIRGEIQARQRIVRLDEVIGGDGIRRCGIILDPDLIPTAIAPRRPFQGWRYLEASDAPPDLKRGKTGDESLPRSLESALAEIGVL